MNTESLRSFNSGKFDGANSAQFANPIHNNWNRDKAGKLVHFNRDYFHGYMEGFEQAVGYRPLCFPSPLN